MIVVTVELWPGGDPARKRHLGTARIHNDLQQSLDSNGATGSYGVRLSKWGKPNQVWREGRIVNFDRVKRGPWDLLLAALDTTVGKRRGRPTPDRETP